MVVWCGKCRFSKPVSPVVWVKSLSEYGSEFFEAIALGQ